MCSTLQFCATAKEQVSMLTVNADCKALYTKCTTSSNTVCHDRSQQRVALGSIVWSDVRMYVDRTVRGDCFACDCCICSTLQPEVCHGSAVQCKVLSLTWLFSSHTQTLCACVYTYQLFVEMKYEAYQQVQLLSTPNTGYTALPTEQQKAVKLAVWEQTVWV
jgi:hypothetical protein